MDALKQRVFELTGNKQVFAMNEADLTLKVILPEIVKPNDQRYFISDEFLSLMTDYGTAMLYARNSYYGELLFELAMQRFSFSCTPIVGRKPSREFECDKTYHQYKSIGGVQRPFNPACWNFIQKQAGNMVRVCGGTHMEEILFSLLFHLTPDGEAKGILKLEDLDGKEVFEETLKLVEELLPISTIYEHWSWATPEGVIKYKNWFRKHWDKIDKEDLIARLGIEGTPEVQRRKLNALIFAY